MDPLPITRREAAQLIGTAAAAALFPFPLKAAENDDADANACDSFDR